MERTEAGLAGAFHAPTLTAQGTGDANRTIVADDTINCVYDAIGLAAGSHDYNVIPRNSGGPGSENAVSTVVVG